MIKGTCKIQYGLLLGALLTFTTQTIAYTESSLPFKKDPISSIHWFPYLLVLGILLTALLFLAKRSKGLMKPNPKCQIIEHIPIHHKTKAYVIDYQGQRFLIADNQNALAIHPLQEEKPSL